ncbi:MAG: FHA domain-containing protein [Armatimonadetes bacterium]|nr:FHA domain-containing protein [Armatimonadota bacterium]
MADHLDSRFELVVLEGGGKDSRHYLNRTRISLGRFDEGDDVTPGVVAFPEPTVSRVHAVLEWDDKKKRYVLHHRSRTNATLINGTQTAEPQGQALNPGDKIKLGRLVVEVRQTDPRAAVSVVDVPEPVETGLHLVVLTGPDAGGIHPLNYTRVLVSEPPAEPDPHPRASVRGVGNSEALLVHTPEGFQVQPVPERERPVLLQAHDGAVIEHPVVEGSHVFLQPGMVLLCGGVVLAPVATTEAGDLAESIRDGKAAHPLLENLKPQEKPPWHGGEQYLLRILSGEYRGTVLYLDPEKLKGPVTLDRLAAEQPALLKLPDKNAARAEVLWWKGRFQLRNADKEGRFMLNWDEMTPEEEANLVSGDRFRLGKTVVRYEHLPMQERIETLALRFADEDIPFARQVNTLGYSTHCDLRIDDRRLGPTHGQFEIRPDGIFYCHKERGKEVKIGDATVRAGEEGQVTPGEPIHLAEEIVVQVVEKSERFSQTEGFLIGPTQEELEAARKGPA